MLKSGYFLYNFSKGGTPELDKWNRMDGWNFIKVSMFHLKHFKRYNL